jgi:hypothetical protein
VQLTCALTLNYIHEIIIFAQGGITAYNDKCNGEPKVKLVAHTYLALIQCVQFFFGGSRRNDLPECELRNVLVFDNFQFVG